MVSTKTPEEVMAMKSNNNAIVIHVKQMGPSVVPRLIMECNNADYWHKFVVENVDTYERDFILKTILDFVYPADMIPVNFVKKRRAFFLARNCLDAVLKLTSSKLVVPNPLHPDMPLKLVIIANHYPAQQLKFDFETDIVKILKKRFYTKNRYLNLKEFYKDKDLTDYFPLSQPKLLLFVLQFAMEFQPRSLNLSNNSIKAINPIRLLAGCKLTSIDLGDNEIAKMEDLEPLKDFIELDRLTLSGNPLCNDWDPFSYANKLREMCPKLTTIDGQTPFSDDIFSKKQKNFLCSAAGGDLVSQFLEHFFMVYDSENRQDIAPLYHGNAMFSVTFRIIPNQKSCENIQLNHYQLIDRNMKWFDRPRQQFLFRGRKTIMKIFADLPRSNHDPFEFHCDLIYYTDVQAILVVNGVFRENKQYIGFTRNFVLKCEDNAYTITNDQLHVYNALDCQIKTSDCYPIPLEISGNPLPFYSQQYTELQLTMRKITTLNYDYSQRYLEACNFDLKKALEIFIEMHLRDEVPPEAFIQVGKEGLLSEEMSKVTKAPFPRSLITKAYWKHPVIAPRTIWQTLKDERLEAGYKTANNVINKDLMDEEIKRNILTAVPSNSIPAEMFTDKPKNTGRKMIQLSNTPRGVSKQQTKVSDPSILQNTNDDNKDVLNKEAEQILTAGPSTSTPVQMFSDKPENTRQNQNNVTATNPGLPTAVMPRKTRGKKRSRKSRLRNRWSFYHQVEITKQGNTISHVKQQTKVSDPSIRQNANDITKNVLDKETEQIKRKILTAVPSNSTPVVQSYSDFRDKPENIGQNQGDVTAADPEPPTAVRPKRKRGRRPNKPRPRSIRYCNWQLEMSQLGNTFF